MVIQSALASALIFLFLATAFGERLSADARERAEELWGRVENNETNGAATMAKVRRLSEEERDLVRAHYRGEMNYYNGREPRSGDQFLMRLAMLGDVEARDKLVSTWVRGNEVLSVVPLPADFRPTWDYPHDLLRLESPEAIAQYGELLFMNEEDQMPSDVGFTAPQKSAGMLVVNTLKKSPVFSEDVREWAYRVWEVKGGLEMVRKWYRDNEPRLKGGDFQAVQPGDPLPEEKRPEPATAPTLIANSTSPEAVAVPTTQPVSEPASTPSSAFLWTGAGVSIALLVGLLVFWKRRA